MHRILLKTTIPFTEDDWHIGRFSLLQRHLRSLTGADGSTLYEVDARDRVENGAADDVDLRAAGDGAQEPLDSVAMVGARTLLLLVFAARPDRRPDRQGWERSPPGGRRSGGRWPTGRAVSRNEGPFPGGPTDRPPWDVRRVLALSATSPPARRFRHRSDGDPRRVDALAHRSPPLRPRNV